MNAYSAQNTKRGLDETSYAVGTSYNTKKEDRNVGELGKEDFLHLLVTQLKHQDPLNPVEDKEFIAQMAQFSSLEQMFNLNSNMSSMRAFSLIGKNITAETIDESTGQLRVIKGEVEEVKLQGSKAYVVVNDVDVLVDRITNIENENTKVTYGEYLLNQILLKLNDLGENLG